MTKINLLEKRKKTIEQRMNRLRSQEAVLNVQLRKKRTRRLIELGGLVSKAQLEDWNVNTLLGALLFLKEQEANVTQLEEWAYRGGSAFSEGKIQNVFF
jgi:chaperonin cofactor prefoldin